MLTNEADNGFGILGVMGVVSGVGGVNVIGRVDEEEFLCQGADPDPEADEVFIGVGSGIGRKAELGVGSAVSFRYRLPPWLVVLLLSP